MRTICNTLLGRTFALQMLEEIITYLKVKPITKNPVDSKLPGRGMIYKKEVEKEML